MEDDFRSDASQPGHSLHFSYLITLQPGHRREKHHLCGVGFCDGRITATVISIPVGHLSDRYGRKKFVVFGALVLATVPFCYIFVSNIFQIIVLQFVSGLGLGMNSPTFTAMLAEKIKEDRRGLGFGILNSSAALVAGIGALIEASIAQFLGF